MTLCQERPLDGDRTGESVSPSGFCLPMGSDNRGHQDENWWCCHTLLLWAVLLVH